MKIGRSLKKFLEKAERAVDAVAAPPPAAPAAPGPVPGGPAPRGPRDAARVGGGHGVASNLGMPESDEAFVTRMYRQYLGRDPEAAGLAHHLGLLERGEMTRAQIEAGISGGPEARKHAGRPAGDAPKRPRKPAGDPPAAAKGPAKPGVVRDGPGGFLWKPKSDSDGKLVVLLPPSLSDARDVKLVGPDGATLEQGRFTSIANGDRAHFRFKKAGGSYAPGTAVVATMPDGRVVRYVVNNPGARND